MAGSREELVHDLRDRITTGRIAPGSHLTESALADEYSLSRTPVRAALRELADEGLVSVEPHRGAFVTEWTTSDAAEVMEIRALLEAHGAALAATRRSAGHLARLRDLCTEMERFERERSDEYRVAIAELNHEFHLTFLEAAASPRLFNIAKDLALAPMMSGSFHYYSDEELARSLSEHRQIVDAIEGGDSARARALAETHLRNAYAALRRRRDAR